MRGGSHYVNTVEIGFNSLFLLLTFTLYIPLFFNNNNNNNNNNNKFLIAHLEFSMRLQLHVIKKNKNLTKRCNY